MAEEQEEGRSCGERGPCPYPHHPPLILFVLGFEPSSPRFPLLTALVTFLPAPFPAPPPPHRQGYAIPGTHPCGRHRPRSHAQRESSMDVEALPCAGPPAPDPAPSCPPLRTCTSDSSLSGGDDLGPALALLPAPPGPARPRHPPPAASAGVTAWDWTRGRHDRTGVGWPMRRSPESAPAPSHVNAL